MRERSVIGRLARVAGLLLSAGAMLGLIAAPPAGAAAKPTHGHHAKKHHRRRSRHHRPHPASIPEIHEFPPCPAGPYGAGDYPPSDPRIIAQATADARYLIGTGHLPAGTAPSTTPPAGSDFSVTGNSDCLQSPDTVGYYSFWKSAGSLQSVIDAVRAHGPPGASLFDEGTTSQAGVVTSRFVTFAFPPTAGVSTSRQLTVTGVPLPGGGAALEVETQVIWVIPRPASEQVPPGVAAVTLDFWKYESDPQLQRVDNTVTVTVPSDIQQIIDLTDGLPAAQPHGGCSGPPNGPPEVDVTFSDANGNTLAEAETSGCGDVSFSIEGQPQYGLGDAGFYYTLNSDYNQGSS